MVDRSVFDGDPPDAINVMLCTVCNRYPVVPGSLTCRWHGAVTGTGTGVQPPADPPSRPNPSGSSPGAPRWFGSACLGAAVVALAGALLLSRSEGAERDADVNEDVADFATEACTP